MSPLQGLMDKLKSIPVALPQAITLRPFGASAISQTASKGAKVTNA
jgi:hypothetical protein